MWVPSVNKQVGRLMTLLGWWLRLNFRRDDQFLQSFCTTMITNKFFLLALLSLLIIHLVSGKSSAKQAWTVAARDDQVSIIIIPFMSHVSQNWINFILSKFACHLRMHLAVNNSLFSMSVSFQRKFAFYGFQRRN